jgi:hypothetical protein
MRVGRGSRTEVLVGREELGDAEVTRVGGSEEVVFAWKRTGSAGELKGNPNARLTVRIGVQVRVWSNDARVSCHAFENNKRQRSRTKDVGWPPVRRDDERREVVGHRRVRGRREDRVHSCTPA